MPTRINHGGPKLETWLVLDTGAVNENSIRELRHCFHCVQRAVCSRRVYLNEWGFHRKMVIVVREQRQRQVACGDVDLDTFDKPFPPPVFLDSEAREPLAEPNTIDVYRSYASSSTSEVTPSVKN